MREMEPKRRAFYEYYAALMEPWDGPAAIAFTDGRQIGATLDRNGLRPARFCVTDDDRVIMASESGVLPIAEEKIVRKWRLQPGRMLLIDLEEGRIVEDEEIKSRLASEQPYGDWLRETQFNLEDLPPAPEAGVEPSAETDALKRTQKAFGYTDEDLKFFLAPMAANGDDPVGSMGTDTPIAALSDRPEAALRLFQAELRAGHQPADRSDPRGDGDEPRLDDRAAPQPARPPCRHATSGSRSRSRSSPTRICSKIRCIHDMLDGAFRTQTLDATWAGGSGQALEAALKRLCWEATEAVLADINMLDHLGPGGRQGPRSDPGRARDRGGAPSPDPPGPEDADRARGRDRRSARSPSFLRARGLRRRGDQSLSRLRDARSAAPARWARPAAGTSCARITSRQSARAC